MKKYIYFYHAKKDNFLQHPNYHFISLLSSASEVQAPEENGHIKTLQLSPRNHGRPDWQDAPLLPQGFGGRWNDRLQIHAGHLYTRRVISLFIVLFFYCTFFHYTFYFESGLEKSLPNIWSPWWGSNWETALNPSVP